MSMSNICTDLKNGYNTFTNTYIVTTSPILKRALLKDLRLSSIDFTVEKEFNNGIYLLRCDSTEKKRIEKSIFRAHRYIKHIHHVDFESTISGKLKEDIQTIKTYINGKNFNPSSTFSVQVRNINNPAYTAKDLEVALGSYIESDFGSKAFFDDKRIPKDVGQRILSILIFDNEIYAGVGNVKENLYPVSDPYRVFSRWETHICRSEFKLREALQLIGYEPKKEYIAIDLGAAPGGWSFVLAEYGLNVIAVDPADLDPRLADIPNVTHFRGKSQNFKLNNMVSLLVNDMNMEPKDSAKVVSSFSNNLYKGALVIMTIKLVNGPYDRRIQEVGDILKSGFRLLDIKLLFHNRQEVTAFFEKL